MNNIIKVASRLTGLRGILHPVKNVVCANTITQQRQLTRNLWYMSSSRNTDNVTPFHKPTELCSCGCGKVGVHTKGERELVEFLAEEILAERKAQKSKTIPTEIDGFQAKLNGAEVSLSKKTDAETINIRFNVNHTVDTDHEAEMHPNMEKPDMGELKSKPSFKVDLIHGETTVSLVCSFIGPNEQEEGYNDVFGIDEISIYNGEWNENVYAVSGEVVDSYLYDLLLNYLEEKGISNEFVEKLSEYSTAFEQSAYIGLLEGLSKFASGK